MDTDAQGNRCAVDGARQSRFGAIYIYDRVGQEFYLVSFDQGSDDTLTIPEFEDLLGEYRLLDCVSDPSQFRASLQEPARA